MKIFLALATIIFTANPAFARDQIRVVGSSTVYPFIAVAAESFGKRGDFKTPVVESTGTGGGFKLFCSGVSIDTPDFINASRAIKPSEIEQCHKNGVSKISEIKLGYDGIVIATSKDSQDYALNIGHIFMALARQIPQNGALIENPYRKWNEIDKALPNTVIQVYGPPPTSGTRDAFVELVMEKACDKMPEYKKLIANEKDRKAACSMLREDGVFIEAGENDNLIVQKLKSNVGTLGILGYSFLEENQNVVKAALINGVAPTAASISSGKYIISRPLLTYAKLDHAGLVPGIKEFMLEMTSDKANGEYGYFAERGLVPLHADEMKSVVREVK